MALHNELGKLGETVAAEYLLMHGYHIMDVGWRIGHLELDIVAEKLGFLIIVEVKTRSSDTFEKPEEAVDKEKRERLLKAGNAYIKYHNLEMPCRFDIISVVGEGEPFRINHIRNAFDDYNWDGQGVYGNGVRRQMHISSDSEVGDSNGEY